jgi:alkylation response protein AidB-like acyl-CoA dehydrogenase
VLNGEKAFISGGGASDVYIVMARTGQSGTLTLFILFMVSISYTF